MVGDQATDRQALVEVINLGLLWHCLCAITRLEVPERLAAVRMRPGRPRQLVGVALWGAVGLLGLHSAGNLVITVGTVGGLLAPSAAWTAAGGVTPRALGYVLFFLFGAALFGVLAVWFHRRHHLGWTAAVAGLAGAPLLLGLLLAAVPAILGHWGLLPT